MQQAAEEARGLIEQETGQAVQLFVAEKRGRWFDQAGLARRQCALRRG